MWSLPSMSSQNSERDWRVSKCSAVDERSEEVQGAGVGHEGQSSAWSRQQLSWFSKWNRNVPGSQGWESLQRLRQAGVKIPRQPSLVTDGVLGSGSSGDEAI